MNMRIAMDMAARKGLWLERLTWPAVESRVFQEFLLSITLLTERSIELYVKVRKNSSSRQSSEITFKYYCSSSFQVMVGLNSLTTDWPNPGKVRPVHLSLFSTAGTRRHRLLAMLMDEIPATCCGPINDPKQTPLTPPNLLLLWIGNNREIKVHSGNDPHGC
ncbi:uncharacterized protein LY79DRAFT_584483 [Colletotrichum navitas]|uniref:Uncharacterized protein n=1 Tax=Colletotrichum navitas TaxID=681940 RepID=A0AAD8UY37_9PEZI|nr:uncharacterized protein LY79DRAFT_584483 [Colletotrichum navitas]KAK1569761.1 hypothetical protein LY79DRAFT_584483 [Colletotrichum navitas]